MKKLVAVLDFVFGCHHGHLSRVFSIDGQTYRVCCGCGAAFEYSLESMRMKRRLRTFDARAVDREMKTGAANAMGDTSKALVSCFE